MPPSAASSAASSASSASSSASSRVESLGILGIESIHYYVHDIERSRVFYTQKLDFAEVGASGAALTEKGRQRSLVFRGGNCVVICSTPVGEGGRAWRFLQKHPDGVGTVVFRVEDIDKTFSLLEARGGTPIDDIETHRHEGGTLKMFSITTPFGDTTFRFVERRDYEPLFPGMDVYTEPRGGNNKFGFEHWDHVTSNFQTMKPALLWLEHVLGFTQLWDVKFHTEDVAEERGKGGSGLRSVVMWDADSAVKFANNEPWRPFFKDSQINIFNEELRGDGVQHVALSVRDIIPAVRGMLDARVEFMPTPGSYYDMLPDRLKRIGVNEIEEDQGVLRELGILVDGGEDKQYMLQIFLKDSAGLYGSADAGPFFYEIIQRKGDRGFGAGNFRALFESIEREQQKS